MCVVPQLFAVNKALGEMISSTSLYCNLKEKQSQFDPNAIVQAYIMNKQMACWTETTQNQSKLECYYILYTKAEYLRL